MRVPSRATAARSRPVRPARGRRPSRSRGCWAYVLLVALGGCVPPAERARLDPPQGDEPRAGPAGAAEELPSLGEGAQLHDYLTYAALNNPGLKAAFHRWRAAVERIPQARSLPDPRLTYGYFIERVETRVGPQRQRLGVMQAFPWFGTLRLRGDAAAAEARAAAQQLEAVRLRVARDVKDAYCELYYLSRAHAITAENVELLKYIESAARSRYRVAGAPYAEVIRAQVELGKLEDELRSLADLRQPVAARLNAALHRPADAPVPWPKAIADETFDVDVARILPRIAEANPELRALEARIEQQRAAVGLARKGYYPDLALGLSYIDTGSARVRTSDSGKDPLVAELSLSLPIWRGKHEATEREARARLASARHALAERRNTLAAETQLALFKLRDAGRKLALYRDALLPRAQQSLKATQTAYEAGKAGLTDLIDAQRLLLAFRLARERARADRAQRLADLQRLMGAAPPRQDAADGAPQKDGSKRGPRRD